MLCTKIYTHIDNFVWQGKMLIQVKYIDRIVYRILAVTYVSSPANIGNVRLNLPSSKNVERPLRYFNTFSLQPDVKVV